MSCSVMASSAVFFLTPAACSCSSSRVTGIFSFSANWATFDLAMCCVFSSGAPALGLRLVLEPGFARLHDELGGALGVHARHLGELVGGEVGEGVHRGDALRCEHAGGLVVHALHALQVLGGVLHILLALDRFREEGVA